jgi:pilus assembly protein Flp/PilA
MLRFLKEEEAATAVEYAVMLALILATVIGSVQTMGANLTTLWTNMSDSMATYGMGS